MILYSIVYRSTYEKIIYLPKCVLDVNILYIYKTLDTILDKYYESGGTFKMNRYTVFWVIKFWGYVQLFLLKFKKYQWNTTLCSHMPWK